MHRLIRGRSFVVSAALFFIVTLFCSASWGGGAMSPEQEEINALKAQVKQLMERIEQLEQKQAAAPAASTGMKAYWKNGFRIEYKDPDSNNEYKFRFRTGIQLRYTHMLRDDDIENSEEDYSSFTMRRLRFFVDGTAPNKDWRYFVHVQLEPKSKVNVHDAFVVWKHYKEFRVQFGRMKIPGLGIEYWQSGFKQNGTDRTIFTDDSEGYWPYDGGTPKLKVGGHLLANGFPIGGMLNYRSQGVVLNGNLDMMGKKQFFCYWLGYFNGRDTQGYNDTNSADKLYSARVGLNWLPGSDPKGPMGTKTFNNYFMQGDYGYNTVPALATIFSTFWAKDRVKTYYDDTGATGSSAHDTENYGFDVAVIFRYMGFSADVEWAWEEFIQAPDDMLQETWDRWAARVNLGYFFVPKKWEAVFKYAYFERLEDNDPINSLQSGLGLVELSNGKVGIEDYMQQFVIGVNHYFHGFNQYITFDVALLQRNIEDASASEAAKVGMSADDFDSEKENDWRFRVMYQHWF